jgi:hypothetical protein
MRKDNEIYQRWNQITALTGTASGTLLSVVPNIVLKKTIILAGIEP